MYASGGVLPYHVVRGPVLGRIYSYIAPSFLLEHQRFTFTRLFPKAYERIAMAALPVPPKGVGTNRCLQLLTQNITSILPCLFLPGSAKLRQLYYVCPPVSKNYKTQPMFAAVSVSLESTYHRSNIKDSAISVDSGRLADVSIPLCFNLSVTLPRFLQRRTSTEALGM